VNNKSARWGPISLNREKKTNTKVKNRSTIDQDESNKKTSKAGAVVSSAKRSNEYQGYRNGTPERTVYISSIPVLIGAVMIAAAILLSTLVNAIGTRYIGIEGPTEDSAWLIDRLNGSVYRCQASVRGKASCETEISTGSITEPAKP
jgi:hypothetical protein